MPADLIGNDGSLPARVDRVEFIRCGTDWCSTPIGVQLGGGRIKWRHDPEHDTYTGSMRVTCPNCGAVRVWTPEKPRNRHTAR